MEDELTTFFQDTSWMELKIGHCIHWKEDRDL